VNSGGSKLLNYRIAANSPCRRAGVDVGLTTDYTGRSWKIPPSIGAFEVALSKGIRIRKGLEME
jgi:hypothetical protein